MRVALKLVLDCPPDAAWEAIRSPDVFREVFHPLANVEPIDPPVFPERWPEGPTLLRITSFSGLVPLGEQLMDVSFSERDDRTNGPGQRTRIFEDAGHAVTGALAPLTLWRHRMAVSATEAGTTLFRDRLDFRGPVALPFWPVLWELWQYRGGRLKKLAPTFEKRFIR